VRFKLQRSLVFWAGVLMTVFIGWAAWDSWEHVSVGRMGSCAVGSIGGGVVVGRDRGAGGGRSFWHADRNPAPALKREPGSPLLFLGKGLGSRLAVDETRVEHVFARWENSARKGDWVLFIPYWLLWMAKVVVWVVLLVWRQRRGRGAMEMIDSRGER
jgi:hypothetical protein